MLRALCKTGDAPSNWRAAAVPALAEMTMVLKFFMAALRQPGSRAELELRYECLLDALRQWGERGRVHMSDWALGVLARCCVWDMARSARPLRAHGLAGTADMRYLGHMLPNMSRAHVLEPCLDEMTLCLPGLHPVHIAAAMRRVACHVERRPEHWQDWAGTLASFVVDVAPALDGPQGVMLLRTLLQGLAAPQRASVRVALYKLLPGKDENRLAPTMLAIVAHEFALADMPGDGSTGYAGWCRQQFAQVSAMGPPLHWTGPGEPPCWKGCLTRWAPARDRQTCPRASATAR